MASENLIVISEDQKGKCLKCESKTSSVATSADGAEMHKHTCTKCMYKFLSTFPAKNTKQICPNCDNDLSVSGSIIRDYSAEGSYDELGHFIRTTDYMDREAPDICSSCLDEILMD